MPTKRTKCLCNAKFTLSSEGFLAFSQRIFIPSVILLFWPDEVVVVVSVNNFSVSECVFSIIFFPTNYIFWSFSVIFDCFQLKPTINVSTM